MTGVLDAAAQGPLPDTHHIVVGIKVTIGGLFNGVRRMCSVGPSMQTFLDWDIFLTAASIETPSVLSHQSHHIGSHVPLRCKIQHIHLAPQPLPLLYPP
jgi:hypothetical protein